MKRIAGIALAVTLALGTAAVVAQPYGMMGGGLGMGMMGGGMMGGGYNIEDRLSAQKAALKITPDQERAWTAYADVAKKQSEAMLTQRAKSQETLSAAYKELYSVLTPEQRAAADQRGPGARWR